MSADQEGTPAQRRYLQGVCRRVQVRLGRCPWVTKHLFGARNFSISVGGNQPHQLREILSQTEVLVIERVFYRDGVTYAYVQLTSSNSRRCSLK